MSKEASEHLAQVVECIYYRLKDTSSPERSSDSSRKWFGTGVTALQFQWSRSPESSPGRGATQCDLVDPQQCYVAMDECRRHCTASSQHSFGRAKASETTLTYSSAASGPKRVFVWTVSETTSPAGAELAPFVAQPMHSQAEQVHHCCGRSWRQAKAHKLHSTVCW